jgi:hypothetical protein
MYRLIWIFSYIAMSLYVSFQRNKCVCWNPSLEPFQCLMINSYSKRICLFICSVFSPLSQSRNAIRVTWRRISADRGRIYNMECKWVLTVFIAVSMFLVPKWLGYVVTLHLALHNFNPCLRRIIARWTYRRKTYQKLESKEVKRPQFCTDKSVLGWGNLG